MIKILLAEDHNIVRTGIRSLLEQEPDMQVIFEAVSGQQVLDYLKNGEAPDLVLTDMNMPGVNGMELIKALKEEYPVLVLSMLDHENYVIETMRQGAKGYLLKNAGKNEVLFAVRQVAAGGAYICAEISLKLLDVLAQIQGAAANEAASRLELSERETEVLNLIAEGFTSKEIATKLFSSRRTIEGHRLSLMDKTGSKNTATLIKYAVQHRLIK
ncbi:MAG: response regulator [Mucilaginibacter sp.]